mgnify:CR=1 FL=1
MENPSNKKNKEEFELYLEMIYKQMGGIGTVKIVWQMIIDSVDSLYKKLNWLQKLNIKIDEISTIINIKYWIKSHLFPSKLPKQFNLELNLMKELGITFNDSEVIRAVNLVSSLTPYKYW